MTPPLCPYCGKPSNLVSGKVLYPRRPDLRNRCYFRCKPCDAHCGVHKLSGKPLGTLADKALRTLRKQAHEVVDHIWQNRWLPRGTIYKRLGFHIGESTVQQCIDLIEGKYDILRTRQPNHKGGKG